MKIMLLGSDYNIDFPAVTAYTYGIVVCGTTFEADNPVFVGFWQVDKEIIKLLFIEKRVSEGNN